MKYLLVIVVVVIVLALMLGRRKPLPSRPRAARGDADARKEEMVRCAHCGVHLPRSDAFMGGGELFCSDAHRLAGPAPDARR